MSNEWYYVRDGARVGPLTAQELKLLVSHGELVATDMVSRKGLGKWLPAAQIRGLFPTKNDAPPAAAATDAPIFSNDDVELTARRLTVGLHAFDLSEITRASIASHQEGRGGAIVALVMMCFMFCMALMPVLLVVVGSLFFGRSMSLSLMSSGLLPALVGAILFIPASTLWNPSKRDYRLVIHTNHGARPVMIAKTRDPLQRAADAVNDAIRSASKASK